MTVIFGIDIHPQFQAGMPIEALPAAGIDFLSVKVSNGTDSRSYLDAGGLDFLERGKRAGLLCLGYHWLKPGAEAAQAAVFAAALARAGVAGVIDAEDIDAHKVPTLRIGGLRAFYAECRRLGAPVAFLYLPRWYWSSPEFGSPDLSGLPILWASSYPSREGGSIASLYPLVGPERWASYGGLPVGPLQFAETALVAGRQPIDVNAYPGDRASLASLLGMPHRLRRLRERQMIQLPATPAPTDPNSDPKSWPGRNFDVPFDLAGGWEGDAAVSFGGQDWSGRGVDGVRSYLTLASWVMPGNRLVPVDPAYTANPPAGGGRGVVAHGQVGPWVAPKGAIGITLNYAAPAGGYAGLGRSG